MALRKSDFRFGVAVVIVAALVIRAINQSMVIEAPKSKYTPPTTQQYIARLVEYFDEPSCTDAMRHFIQLVEAGVEPNHAFDMVTRVVYSD